MWTCNTCGTDVDDDTWEECWKCLSPRHLDAGVAEALRQDHATRLARHCRCLRCEARLEYAGTKRFHEGAKLGFWLGDLGELFVGREAYDVYFCPVCGKVEFFLDGVGEAMRGEGTAPDEGGENEKWGPGT